MNERIEKARRTVAATAQHIQGRPDVALSTEKCRAALLDLLQRQGVPLQANVECEGDYGDVTVSHRLDVVVDGVLAVEVRSAEDVLENQYYQGLVAFCAQQLGLSHGLLLRFSSNGVEIVDAPLPPPAPSS